MSNKRNCDKCSGQYCRLKSVQLRVVFGIHSGDKSVFAKKVHHWCGRCRAVHDGKWRHARKGK